MRGHFPRENDAQLLYLMLTVLGGNTCIVFHRKKCRNQVSKRRNQVHLVRRKKLKWFQQLEKPMKNKENYQFTNNERMVIVMALSQYKRDLKNNLDTESKVWSEYKEIFRSDLKYVNEALCKLNQLQLI